jgi:hypothetical protein
MNRHTFLDFPANRDDRRTDNALVFGAGLARCRRTP